MRTALEATLQLVGRTSVEEVASSLGYKGSAPLWERFPDLCAELASGKKRKIREAIELALEDASAPTMRAVARRLGYKGDSRLRKSFPDLCRKVTARRREFLINLRDPLRLVMQTALEEHPPPSVREICRRLKMKRDKLERASLQLCKEISRRHREYLHEQANSGRARSKELIREAVLALSGTGVRPSFNQVSKLVRLQGRSYRFFSDIFHEVRRELGLK